MDECVIMGAAVGYTRDQVAPFLTSLRKCGYRGPVVLVVDARLERSLRERAIASDITLIRIRQWPRIPALSRNGRMRRLWRSIYRAMWAAVQTIHRLPLPSSIRVRSSAGLGQLLCTPMESRFLHYERFLRVRPHSRVLISDVRDVLFQNDPFKQLPRDGLAVSIETSNYTIATEPHNAEWITAAYGAQVLEEIGKNPVSCVGVTYGDFHAMTRYLGLMRTEILQMPAAIVGAGGTDTAVHNFLLWTNRLGSFRRLETLASPVATLNGVNEEQMRLSGQGKLLNRDGSEASVVHQYDRVPGLRSRLLAALAT